MGCARSDEGDGISKRLKLPKKFLGDINTVHHAPVPRKLRSVIRKRSRDSISPPLPASSKMKCRENEGELKRKCGVKKTKLNTHKNKSDNFQKHENDWSSTKAEVEVIEALITLAGIFPVNDKTDITKINGELAKSKFSASPESSTPAFEDSVVMKEQEGSKTVSSPDDGAADPLSGLEGSAEETVKLQDLNEAADLNSPIESDQYIPHQVNNTPAMPLFSKSEATSERPSCSSAVTSVRSELNLENGSKQTRYEETPTSGRKPEIALEPVAAFGSQLEQTPPTKTSTSSGPALWPGLSSTGSRDTQPRGSSLKTSTAKLPSWIGNSTSGGTQPCSSEKLVLTEKNSREVGPTDTNKLAKRLAAHVRICHLIKGLQTAETKDKLPMQPALSTADEGSKSGGLLLSKNVHDKSQDDVRNAMMLHQRLLQDQQRAITTSGIYSSQNQCFDLSSVSAGNSGVEAFGGTKRRKGKELEPLTQFHLPYLQSVGYNHTAMALSQPQNRYYSTSFPDHLSTAAEKQVQVPPYLFGSSRMQPTILPKQQQQQQQRIWTAQPAANYRANEVAAAHLPNWQQNRRQDSPIIQYSQPTHTPNSHPSLQLLGPKYATISPHQQQFIPVASLLPPTRLNKQHNIPSGYGGKNPPLLIDRA